MYNNNYMIDRLSKQKEEIDNLIKNYQTPMNVFNVGNQIDFEAKIISKEENPNDIMVQRRTAFICFDNALLTIKETNYDKFRKYKIKLKGMAYNYEIDEELAKEIVSDMKPLGEYWNMETVRSVIKNDTHRLEDMYVVMNSLVNDYQNVVSSEETETYIKMAHAWLDDVDGKEHKIWWYFVK